MASRSVPLFAYAPLDVPVGSRRARLADLRPDLPGRFSEIDVLRRQWARVEGALSGVILPPYEVLIHPSSACNLRCAWCIGDHVPITNEDQSAVLDSSKQAPFRLPDRLRDVASMMKLVRGLVDYRRTWTSSDTLKREFAVENVTFSGLIGEPLVSKDAVAAAMEFLVDHGVRVGLFTNGILMDETMQTAILRTAFVHLSLDAGTPGTYSRLKAGNKADQSGFGKALANLRSLIQRRNASDAKLEINASFILYPENYSEVFEAAETLKSIGVEKMRLKRDISGTRILSPAQRLEAQDQIERIRAQLTDDTFELIEVHRTDDLPGPRQFPRCHITNLVAAVGSDGNVYPCNYHPRPNGYSFGSAIDAPFGDVWESVERMELRDRLPSICPAVCDPFKNRANKMLNGIEEVFETGGLGAAQQLATELVELTRSRPNPKYVESITDALNTR